MNWQKVWRLGVLVLVTAALIALALMPIPSVEVVVQMPGRGQRPNWQELLGSLGLAALGLVLLLGPPALMIWLALRVLRYGRFLGKEASEIAPFPH